MKASIEEQNVLLHGPPPKTLESNKQNDYICLSIVNLFTCCCLGIPALVFSLKARKQYRNGSFKNGKKYGIISKRLNIGGILIFILLVILIIVLILLKSILFNTGGGGKSSSSQNTRLNNENSTDLISKQYSNHSHGDNQTAAEVWNNMEAMKLIGKWKVVSSGDMNPAMLELGYSYFVRTMAAFYKPDIIIDFDKVTNQWTFKIVSSLITRTLTFTLNVEFLEEAPYRTLRSVFVIDGKRMIKTERNVKNGQISTEESEVNENDELITTFTINGIKCKSVFHRK